MASSMNGNPNRKSYILSLDPVTYSLTAGTNIPAPLESPPHTPAAEDIRPPTPGGGPLTSHPTTPDDMPPNFPPTPEPEKNQNQHTGSQLPKAVSQARNDSFRTPTSPASAMTAGQFLQQEAPHQPYQPQQPRRTKPTNSVRKLLSLNNLRSSFSSSRTSLSSTAVPRTSHDNQSTLSSSTNNNYTHINSASSRKRPASPSPTDTSTDASSTWSAQPRPPLRTKKSGSWFRRKSGMFLSSGMMDVDAPLDAVDEGSRPDTQESWRSSSNKRVKEKEAEPAPMLPEFQALETGGGFDGGSLGWDEGRFGR